MTHELVGVALDIAFRLVGQQRLARGDGIGGRASAHHRIGAYRLGAVDLVDVDHVETVEHGKVHGFSGLVGQRAHVGRGQLAHVQLGKLTRRQLEQPDRAAIAAAVIVLGHIARMYQRLQGAVRVAASQSDPGGQRIDGARRIVHVGHRLQHHQTFEQRLVHFLFS